MGNMYCDDIAVQYLNSVSTLNANATAMALFSQRENTGVEVSFWVVMYTYVRL